MNCSATSDGRAVVDEIVARALVCASPSLKVFELFGIRDDKDLKDA